MVDKFLAEGKPKNFGLCLFGVFCPPVNGDVHAVWVIQSDQDVSVRLMITIQKVTSNVQSVPRQSPDI
jgi:hypothetical protein